MKKEITLGTKIIFTATGEKYSIIEQTVTGFMFKPIKFEKGLPTVPRTFEEIKNEFLSGEIDIENFEHNDADNRLVELIMDGYIKASEIKSLIDCSADLASEKGKLESQLTEKDGLLQQKETTLQENEKTILAHEATISEQQDAIQEQKDFMQGQKDTIQEQTNILKITKETTIELGKQISELNAELEKEKQAHATDKENWNEEEEKYKSTIEGLEASIPEKV